MWLSASCFPAWSSSALLLLWHCRSYIVDRSLNWRPPSHQVPCDNWSTCTGPQAGPPGWSLPSRSLAGCLCQGPPPAPPGNIQLSWQLLIKLIFPSLYLAGGCPEGEHRLQGDNTGHTWRKDYTTYNSAKLTFKGLRILDRVNWHAGWSPYNKNGRLKHYIWLRDISYFHCETQPSSIHCNGYKMAQFSTKTSSQAS